MKIMANLLDVEVCTICHTATQCNEGVECYHCNVIYCDFCFECEIRPWAVRTKIPPHLLTTHLAQQNFKGPFYAIASNQEPLHGAPYDRLRVCPSCCRQID